MTHQRSSPSRDRARTGANEIYRTSANNFRRTFRHPVAYFKPNSCGLSEAKNRLPLPRLMAMVGDGEHAKKSAPCPFHQDRAPSFSVFEGRGGWFWKCHAGCGQGDGVDYLKTKFNLSTADAIRRLCDMAGVRQGKGRR